MSIVSFTTRKNARAKQKKLPKGTTFLSWLKLHTSELDLGLKTDNHPFHLNTNESVLDHFKRLRAGERSWLRHRLNWYKLVNHANNVCTYYFAGAQERAKRRTMFMLDVDCKRRGTAEGAKAFLEYLASRECKKQYRIWFPNLFVEASTNGKGAHGFALLEKLGAIPEEINPALLRRLMPFLNRIAQEQGFTLGRSSGEPMIEFVEVKGTVPVITWGNEWGEVLHYQSGTLAKIPREVERRFAELQGTSVITMNDLMALPLAPKARPKVLSCPVTATQQDDPPASGLHFTAGSVSGRHFGAELLAGLAVGGRFHTVAETLLNGHPLNTSGRQAVTVEDVAIALMLGEFLTNHMEANGAMPTARWRKLWMNLYESGDISRAWDHHRFKAVRDYLSSLGLIEWQDSTYVLGWHDGQGDYHKGQAAKWKFSKDLMNQLTAAGQAADTLVSVVDNVDNGEEKKTSSMGTDLTEWVSTLQQLSGKGIIRPVLKVPDVEYRLNPDEITLLITPFEQLAA
jgi:hypothetical protein